MRHATAPRAIQVPAALAGHADGNSTTPALVILIAAAFALGACGTQAPRSESDTSAPMTPAPASLPPADLASSEASTPADDEPLPALTCGEAKAARYMGQAETPALHETVSRAVGHAKIRWVHPGDAVTQDYAPGRLNVILDETGRISAVRCG